MSATFLPLTNKIKIIFKKQNQYNFFFLRKIPCNKRWKNGLPDDKYNFPFYPWLVLYKRTRRLTLSQSTTRVHRNQKPTTHPIPLKIIGWCMHAICKSFYCVLCVSISSAVSKLTRIYCIEFLIKSFVGLDFKLCSYQSVNHK